VVEIRPLTEDDRPWALEIELELLLDP